MLEEMEADISPGYRVMLSAIDEEACATFALTGIREFSPQVLAAMATVPRHLFVPPGQEIFACGNYPLPIGHGQTISQPYMVTLMTELLAVDKHSNVLEVGTGCGYQAAVLAEVARQVHSVEIVKALARDATARLQELGYRNVHVYDGDGYEGWSAYAPYDGIIVTAAAPSVPHALVEQLNPGGRMILPIGKPYLTQELVLLKKDLNGRSNMSVVLPVSFVPLIVSGAS